MPSEDAAVDAVVSVLATPLSRGSLRLALDFDGTLVPLAPTPDAIEVPAAIPPLLRALCEAGHRVAVVSGRPRSFLRDRLWGAAPFDDVLLIGLHGLEWPGEGEPPRDVRLDDAIAAVDRAAGRPAGFLVEDKGRSVAFHTRQVDERQKPTLVQAVRAALAPFAVDDLTLLAGHEVLELRPQAASKASALRRLKEADGDAVAATIFIGDDVTDEEGFAALGVGDLGIRVGVDVQTRASLCLPSPLSVQRLLERLLGERSEDMLNDGTDDVLDDAVDRDLSSSSSTS